jgi:osmotically-inducible protein OsmY
MPASDETPTREVRAKLAADPHLDPLTIEAEVGDGRAVLTGQVASHAERLRAATISAEIPGVEHVDNRLTVRAYGAGWRTTDDEIAEGIARALLESGLSTDSIGFEVSDHVVILTGRVATAEDRAALRHCVQSVPHVDFIDNRVTVGPARAKAQAPSRELDEVECWTHLLKTEIGRLAIRTDPGVDIFPVNYLVHDGALYFRTAPGTKLEELVNQPDVAFEIDGLGRKRVWSVVVRGTATRMNRDDDIHTSGILELRGWAPGEKHNFVRIQPTSITGRAFLR